MAAKTQVSNLRASIEDAILVGETHSEQQNRIIAADSSFQAEITQEISRLRESATTSLSSADVSRNSRDVNVALLKKLRLELTQARIVAKMAKLMNEKTVNLSNEASAVAFSKLQTYQARFAAQKSLTDSHVRAVEYKTSALKIAKEALEAAMNA